MINLKLGMVIAAGGSGSRFSRKVNKLLVEYNDKPLLIHTLEMFYPVISPGSMVVAAPADLLDEMQKITESYLPDNNIRWTVGGSTRISSVYRAAMLLDDSIELIAVHDAARPLASVELLKELCEAARLFGGAVPGMTPVDTIKQIDSNGFIDNNLIRKELAAVATPQVFKYVHYMQALKSLPESILSGQLEDPLLTDDAAVFMRQKNQVKVVYSSLPNHKITVQSDLKK